MMRLYIEGRQVDLMQDEPLLITREIADIREPEKRSSDWSKTFRIPGTSNNNRVFGHIFDIAQEQLNTGTQFAPDFNPNKKAAALITVDEVEQVRGFVRLLNIAIVRGGEIEYEVSVHGVAADFFAKIRNKRMSDIDLSDLNHVSTKTVVKNSWSHTAEDGYVYAMIDRGRVDKPFNTWGVNDLTPCVFAKTIVDRIFADAGYSYTDDSFFNSAEFKSRVIPFPRYPMLSETTIATYGARVRRSSDQSIAWNAAKTIVWNDDSSTGYFDNGGHFDTSTGLYNIPTPGIGFVIKIQIDYSITGLNNVTYPWVMAVFDVKVGGKVHASFSDGGNNQAVAGVNRKFTTYVRVGWSNTVDDISINLRWVGDPVFAMSYGIASGWTVTIKANSFVEFEAVQGIYGSNYLLDFNSMFAGLEFKQDTFLSDLVKMDNLYIEPTDQTGVLYIQPREDFYRDTVVHDLTPLIDRSQPFEIIPMGELDGNPYVFTYKQGKDIDSEDYAQSTGKVYGEARIIVDNEFISQEKTIQTGFASTPYAHAGGQIAIGSMEAFDKSNGDARILYYSGKIGDNSWFLCDWVGDGGRAPSLVNPEQITGGYPHAGHLDNPWEPTKDLNFGMPEYINLPGGILYTNNNLYNRNWRKYINEITDRNSKLVRARVYITPAEWYKWSFRDLYFFDGQYFRLNKITDYPVGGSDLVVCEFLKLKSGGQFTPQTSRAGGGYDVKDDYDTRWPDLKNGFDRPAKNFSYFDVGGGNTGNYKPVIDLVNSLNDISIQQVGDVATGDKFRPTIEWSGSQWEIVLIQEP